MTEPARERSPRTSVQQRRREVRQCLADLGFARGRLRLWRPTVSEKRSTAARLRQGLESLGPVFLAFGRYLASWGELVPAPLRRALTDLPPPRDALPADAVRRLITVELGRPLESAFAEFEEVPCTVGLASQVHRARLHSGEPVAVRAAIPGRAERLTGELAALPQLQGALSQFGDGVVPISVAVTAFCQTVHEETDFAHAATALAKLERDAAGVEGLFVPRAHSDLSTPRQLVRDQIAGPTLAELLAPSSERRSAAHDRFDLAGRLCTVWLSLALLGPSFPADTAAEDVTVLADGRIGFRGALCVLPAAARRDLWDYLLAVSNEDPDGACPPLFRLLEKDSPWSREDGLRHRLRQAVVFQTNGKGENSRVTCLRDVVLLHLRLAREERCRPSLHLARLFRALLLMEDAARRLAPGRDWLREGLENLRIVVALGQVRDLFSPGQLNLSLERYAPVLLELPRKMDEVLRLAAEGSARMQVQLRETTEGRGRQNAMVRTAALLLVLAGMALLARHLAAAEALGDWGETVGVGVLVLGGVFLLTRLGGGR